MCCQSSHRVGFGKELLVFVVESIVEEQGRGAVPAKKHVYREYITIKSHPMDDCHWKCTLSLLIRSQKLFQTQNTKYERSIGGLLGWSLVSLLLLMVSSKDDSKNTGAILYIENWVSRVGSDFSLKALHQE